MSKRILVVDPENYIRKVVVANLQRAGYVTVEAVDGAEALQVVADNPPDLVITEITLAQVDGYTLLEQIKSNPMTRRDSGLFSDRQTAESGRLQGLGIGGRLLSPQALQSD